MRAVRTSGVARRLEHVGLARWLEAAIRVPVAAAERLGTLLIEAGSHGVITGVRELSRGTRLRTHETVRGFFPYAKRGQAQRSVKSALKHDTDPAIADAHVTWRELDSGLWEMDWRRHFKPVLAGRSLAVVPPWDRKPQRRRRRVVIHPGMAFGTGQHATTLACLEALERLASPPPAAALDVGTGTGVLAIALAKLGVRHVLALDTDPCAINAARANVRRNGVGKRVRLSTQPLEAQPPKTYPLVVANLYVDALVALAPTLATCVAAGGHLITSGVLRTQQGRLRTAFPEPRWRVRRVNRRGSWATTIFERQFAPSTDSVHPTGFNNGTAPRKRAPIARSGTAPP